MGFKYSVGLFTHISLLCFGNCFSYLLRLSIIIIITLVATTDRDCLQFEIDVRYSLGDLRLQAHNINIS